MSAMTRERWRTSGLIESSAPAGYVLIETFSYQDKDGNTAQIAARYEPLVADGEKKKTFKQFTVEKGAIVAKAMADKRPLYNLPELLANHDKPVLVVEGEGVAHRARELFGADFVVTTSIGGARAAGRTDWTPLNGRPVIIWRDLDEAGLTYAQDILKQVPDAKVVKDRDLRGFPPKWDLADDPPAGMTKAGLRRIIDETLAQVDLEEAIGVAPAGEAITLPRITSMMSGNGKAPLSQAAKARKAEAKALADKYCNKDGTPLTEEQLKEEVAGMDDVAYERARRGIATGTGVRTTALDRLRADARKDRAATSIGDGIEPWSEEVDGEALLEEIVAEARRYLILPEGGAEAIALWVLFAHAHDSFYISPLLAFLSPTPEAGKTTAFTFLKALTPRALGASNITPAALFRTAEKWKPTLLVDELDSFLKVSDELRGVLNAGHHRGEAIIRCVGESLEPQRFEVFCPKALAAIGKLPATLVSRSIAISMRRKMISEVTKELRPERADVALLPLKQQAMRWAMDNAEALRGADPDMPASLYGRAADNWRPLIAIGDLAGISWGERAREVAVLLGGRRDETMGVLLLDAIREILAAGNHDRIKSEELAAALAEREGEPWPEFRNGKPITPTQVAKLLKPFGIAPGTIRLKTGTGTPKGYYLAAFADAFKRYLSPQGSPDLTATPPHD